jgi:hypothetical protein
VFVARTFRFWQRLGLHVVLNRFDQPVPDTRTLSETHWSMKSELVGIDVRRHDERTAGSVWIRYVA